MTLKLNFFLLVLICMAAIITACGGSVSKPISPAPTPPQPQAVVLPVPSAAPEGDDFHPDNKGWFLAWSDEFSGDELDRTKWEVEQSCWGGGNEERQCYTDRPENVEVINGLLRLKAYPERYTGPQYPQGWPGGDGGQITQQYTSGKVRTRTLADWKYGRFSARMKLPNGQGTWPAFWMMPIDNVYGGWAASGEIDIMEAVNLGATCVECSGDEGENRTLGALHYGGVSPQNKFQSSRNTIPGGVNSKDDYHVYAVEWGEGRINWFVDDELFWSLDSSEWESVTVNKETHPHAPFDQNFYLMLNLAVGGRLSEDNNAGGFVADNFPTEVLVDWVRVYQCEYDGAPSRTCMAENP